MRQLRYSVATSLDGFIAGPGGEYDWIVPDPAIDFAAMHARFDTYLMGRRTYEVARTRRDSMEGSGQQWIVVSTTLKPGGHADATILDRDIAQSVAAFKARPGKDIWLFGGGVLFRSLLDAGLVDVLELAVIPVLLGSGTPLLSAGQRATLRLDASKALPSGILMLTYSIPRGSASSSGNNSA